MATRKTGLTKWFKQNWVDIGRPKKNGKFQPCGRRMAKTARRGYPKCVPASKARRMTKKQIRSAVRRKRAKELRELGQKIYLSELTKQLFNKHEVLIENKNGIGKTANNYKVKLKNKSVGSIVNVTLSKIEDNFLKSEFLIKTSPSSSGGYGHSASLRPLCQKQLDQIFQ